tara:strand:+ start:218 stop:637 length:420 start_codon:yes stop_codon:yes gene_type:complete
MTSLNMQAKIQKLRDKQKEKVKNFGSSVSTPVKSKPEESQIHQGDISDKELADKRAAKKAAMQKAAARKAEIRAEIAKESIETIDIIGPNNMNTVVNSDGLWKGTEQIIQKENQEADGTPSSVEENLSNWKGELRLRWE